MDREHIPLKRPIEDDEVKYLIDNAEMKVMTVFDKCTVVICKLPNGFVIVESSSCVDPKDYSEEVGIENCCRRIIDKVYELTGYKRQLEMNGGNLNDGHED